MILSMRRFVLTLFMTLLVAAPALAQQADDDEARRTALAAQMHEIKPARVQIEMVVDEIAQRLPEENRPLFRSRMLEEFDFPALEALSIEAMAEVFTVAELQKMVDYFGSAEAESIDEKMPVLRQIIQPEITRMVDRALMVVRTGAPGDAAPAQPRP